MTTKLSSAQNEVTRSSHRLDAAAGLARGRLSRQFLPFDRHRKPKLIRRAEIFSLLREPSPPPDCNAFRLPETDDRHGLARPRRMSTGPETTQATAVPRRVGHTLTRAMGCSRKAVSDRTSYKLPKPRRPYRPNPIASKAIAPQPGSASTGDRN
jgi:hypothetical protein